MKTIRILGYETSAAGLPGDIANAWDILASGSKGKYVACSNPHSLVVARTEPVFRRALKEADILLPDGFGIVMAAKILGMELQERVAGSEFFVRFSEEANTRGGLKYFFLGSTEDVLEKIVQRLHQDYPNIVVCGVLSPPFREEFSEDEDREMLQKINEARPDVLWVGMTAPKQEKWIHKNRDMLDVPLTGAIGAVFDFYAGTKKRAPEWVCNLGLEWLPRLLREPRRLFRRNFVSTPLFLMMVFKEKFQQVFGRV